MIVVANIIIIITIIYPPSKSAGWYIRLLCISPLCLMGCRKFSLLYPVLTSISLSLSRSSLLKSLTSCLVCECNKRVECDDHTPPWAGCLKVHHLIYDKNFPQNLWSNFYYFSHFTDEETELCKNSRGKDQAVPQEWTAMGFDSRHLMSVLKLSISLVLYFCPQDHRPTWWLNCTPGVLTLSSLWTQEGSPHPQYPLSSAWVSVPWTWTQCRVAWPVSQSDHPP